MSPVQTPLHSPLFRVFFGALCISFAPVFVKLVHLPPTTIGFYRVLIASIFLLPFVRFRRMSPDLLRALLFAGALFAADLYVWHRAVVLIGAGMGTILGNTQALYVTLAGFLFLGERPSRVFVASVCLALVGIYLMVNVQTEIAPENYTAGVLFGLSTGVVYASYILTMRSVEKRFPAVPALYKMFVVCSSCAVFLALLCGLEGSLSLPDTPSLLWLCALALISQIAGWVIITRNLPFVAASLGALILLIQPSFATLWGVLFFDEAFSLPRALGAGLTFTGIYLGAREFRG